jgi:putative hydrolase of the HAD superfamily
MPTPYRAVFLDVGDTLVHANPSWPEIISRVAASHGADVTLEALVVAERAIAPDIARRFAAGERHTSSLAKSEAFWTWVYDGLLAHCDVDAGARAGIARACHVAFNDLASWIAFIDTGPLLEALDVRRTSGLHVGVLSNWESWLEPLLVSLGIAPHVDAFTVSGEIGLEKPDPGIFDHALAAAGLDRSLAHLAIHVGDSWSADVVGARGVGISPVWLDRDGRGTSLQVQSTTTIRTLAELPSLIDAGLVKP